MKVRERQLVSDQWTKSEVRNDLFNPHKGVVRRRKAVEGLWYVAKWLFFISPVPWPHAVRRRVLITFGASIGRRPHFKQGVDIHFPWNLRVGHYCWFGTRTVLLNLAPIQLGDHVALAHEVYLAAAGHDIGSRTMRYLNQPIVVDGGCWIGTRAYVGGGVHLGEYAVVAAGAVVVKDVGARTVVGGNPARDIGRRVFRG